MNIELIPAIGIGLFVGAALWELARSRGWVDIGPHPFTWVISQLAEALPVGNLLYGIIPPLWPLPLTRRGKLRALRTMELWAWWSRLKLDCGNRAIMVCPGLTGPATVATMPYARPALKLGYRGYASDYLFIDRFDRKRVELFYAGNVGGYTRDELKALTEGADTDAEADA